MEWMITFTSTVENFLHSTPKSSIIYAEGIVEFNYLVWLSFDWVAEPAPKQLKFLFQIAALVYKTMHYGYHAVRGGK